MRTGTLLVLVGLVLLFAYFGWAAFGILAATALAFLLLAIAGVLLGLWVIKRRMRRKLQELAKAMEHQFGREADASAARRHAIETEGRVVRKPRDGADAPDD